ncbi:chymotrypsin family serine protease [Actinophytocola xanthii]|uniref:Peptidase S1 domain-containing protein n=1 Tax=Actinophytocola xanthii TaxID=1912961 RepID=A0A1Q8CWT0_9PSEU|nr:hypothetical protein [Actinophytocola xanthii]OLF18810.1 hypothetical protein BU204_04760 [Actinophytocola xanthii]
MVAAVVVVASLGVLVVPASAATYYFYPGHPTFFGGPGVGAYCTGGYAIRGDSGMFILTAGHCAGVGTPVYGTSRQFGTVAHSRWSDRDTALIQELPGDDAHQIVVDPHTGTSPGRIEGIFPTSSLGVGTLVGKMGVTTGWSEGTITGTIAWYGMTAYCSTAETRPGDSGGPVWATDGGGVLAVGITVAYYEDTGDGCFLPIQDLLDEWDAWLPVFGSAARDGAPPAAQEPPALSIEGLRPALSRR